MIYYSRVTHSFLANETEILLHHLLYKQLIHSSHSMRIITPICPKFSLKSPKYGSPNNRRPRNPRLCKFIQPSRISTGESFRPTSIFQAVRGMEKQAKSLAQKQAWTTCRLPEVIGLLPNVKCYIHRLSSRSCICRVFRWITPFMDGGRCSTLWLP